MTAKPGIGFKIWTTILSVFVAVMLFPNIVGRRGVGWREVEVLSDPRGRPLIHLHGRAAARAAELGLTGFAVSLSHERSMAIATVVAWGNGP